MQPMAMSADSWRKGKHGFERILEIQPRSS